MIEADLAPADLPERRTHRRGSRRPRDVVVLGPDAATVADLLGDLPGIRPPRVLARVADLVRVRADLVVVCSPTPGEDVALLARVPGSPGAVVVVTSAAAPGEVVRALRAGATGYLVDGHFTRADLVGAVVGALAGEHHLSEPAVRALVGHALDQPSGGTLQADERLLSARQREIMDLLARGRSNAEIAAELVLSEKTVRNQISSIYARIGVRTRPEAMIRWLGEPVSRTGP